MYNGKVFKFLVSLRVIVWGLRYMEKSKLLGNLENLDKTRNVAMCSLCGGGSSCSCGSCGACSCGSCSSALVNGAWY